MDFAVELDFCLLIPCYNNAEGLLASLKTVRYPPNLFKIIVVDDGSTQPLKSEDFATLALPLHIIWLPKNEGITKALNTGLDWILKNTITKYIARLDSGDRCHRDRFYKQVGFLQQHPDVGLLGSWCVFENECTGGFFNYKAPLKDAAIRRAMHLRNVFIHPTVMWRSRLHSEAGMYPYDYPHAEDFAFFWLLLQKSTGAILPEFLVTCSLNKGGISEKYRQAQLRYCRKIINLFGEKPLLKVAGNVITLIRALLPQKVIFLLKKSGLIKIY